MGEAKRRKAMGNYGTAAAVDARLLEPGELLTYFEKSRERGLLLAQSIANGDTISKSYFELLKFILEHSYQGACHSTSAVLHMLFKEAGLNSTLCLGEVGIANEFFDHSWVEIDGQIFDAAVCMPDDEGVTAGGPVFANIDLSTGAASTLQYGASSKVGLNATGKWVLSVDLQTYAEKQPVPNIWVLAVLIHSRCGHPDATFKGFSDSYGAVRRTLRA